MDPLEGSSTALATLGGSTVNRDDAAVDTGVHQVSGAYPAAIRAPRARKSVTMIKKMRPRIR